MSLVRVYLPRGIRTYPEAQRIAQEIRGPLMALRNRRLVADIMQAKGVCRSTAQKAISLARWMND